MADYFRADLLQVILVGAVLGLCLLVLRPGERAPARNALLVLFGCAMAVIAVGASDAGDATKLGRIVVNLTTVVTALVVIRLASMLILRALLPHIGLGGPRIVEDLIVTALFVGWSFIWLSLAGVDLASLVTTSAIITAVVAFSMQDTLGNVLGGVSLQLDNSIRVGDWVRIDDISGQVVEVRWRYTAVETRNWETVLIPNSWLMKNRFTVIGSRAKKLLRWRRWIWVNVALTHPATRVCAVLERAVTEASIDNVAHEPAPSAVLMEIGATHGRYALRYWLIDPRADDGTDSVVRAHVLSALARHAMEIGVPLESRLISTDNESRRAAQESEELARRRNALKGVDLFKSLAESERESLAAHLVHAPFVAGDLMTQQGAIAHWLYLIVAGEADVWVDLGVGRRHITTLGEGSVFGEMGMMTGEPRRANVTARTDVECYRLDKAGFEDILRARPDIAAEISQVLASRAQALEQHTADARTQAARATGHDDILALIRKFFGLDEPPG